MEVGRVQLAGEDGEGASGKEDVDLIVGGGRRRVEGGGGAEGEDGVGVEGEGRDEGGVGGSVGVGEDAFAG